MKIAALYKLYTQHSLVDTDTRKIRKNTLFFALKGDNFNGNSFAEEALNLGASFAIIDDKAYQTKKNIILVDNVLKTLQQLANYHRRKLGVNIVGLTGSNGKTTTKELIAIVLRKKYNILATKGNLNNHIGVPLTLLSMTDKTELGIVEMGANHQKEIAFLCTICEPDYGYITNFGKAHLAGFGGMDGVIKGKSELYTFLKENSKTAFVNPEDKIQLEKSKALQAVNFKIDELKFIEATPFVQLSYRDITIQSNLIGAYNYSNIAAAISIGAYFKVSEKEIKEAIESYVPQNNRSQIIETASNKIILDAYNANPSSMRVALENFATIKTDNKVVIMGDMFELGEETLYEHQAIVDLATSLSFDEIFLVGENFHQTVSEKHQFLSYNLLETYIKKKPLEKKSILIKGSRGMRLERILDVIN